MKHRLALVNAAFMALLFTGCFKHSHSATTNPKLTNLGVVEVSDGGTNRIDLGNGKVCVIKSILSQSFIPPELNDKVLLIISVEQTDSSGVTRHLYDQNLMSTFAGQTVGFSENDFGILLTPHIKQ